MKHKDTYILSTKIISPHLLSAAAAKHILIDCVPFISVIPAVNEEIRGIIRQLQTKNSTVIFTSSNAVLAIAPHLTGAPAWNVFCIEGVTSSVVSEKLPRCTIIGTAAHAAGLAEKILKHPEQDFIFFCGKTRLNTIPRVLKENNRILREYPVYETKPVPQKISRTYDAILFFSPSGAKSFFSENETGPATSLFSIGPTTTGYLKKHAVNIIECPRPDTDALIAAVIDYYQSSKDQSNTNSNDPYDSK